MGSHSETSAGVSEKINKKAHSPKEMRPTSIVRLEALCRVAELHLACGPEDVAEIATHTVDVWNRPAGTFATEPLDVVRHVTLIFRPLDLDPLFTLRHVVERDNERDVPLPAVAGVVPADIEATSVTLQVTFEFPAFTGIVFLLNCRDGDDDRSMRTFELELYGPTGFLVPIEE